jgi:voltage-gated potassium channel
MTQGPAGETRRASRPQVQRAVRLAAPEPPSLALLRFGASPLRHVRVGLLVLAILVAVGTLGFRWIASMTWIDAIYMTITTLSTVGYGEVRPLGPSGRLFATGLIVAGVGAALYTAGALAEFLIAGRVGELLGRRAMERALASLRDHVIVCGYGRLGRAVGIELERAGVPQVIVEEDPAVLERLGPLPHPVIQASAADEGALASAGLGRARAIVAATGSEAMNVYIALAAREASPTIAIHARAETEAGARRLRRAGANQVVSPHHLGGQRLAHAILRPAVVDFLELTSPGRTGEIDLEEVVVASGAPLASLAVGELAGRGVRVSVVAIKRGAEPLALNPAPDARFAPGDRVVVVGERESVNRLAELAARSG